MAGTRTPGASFPASRGLPASAVVISKAAEPAADAYSGFSGTVRRAAPPGTPHGPGYVNKRLNFEDVAEYEYRPAKCRKVYRVVVVGKNISRMKGELTLVDEIRYFFHITTRRDADAAEVVRLANARCDRENVVAQLKALRVPLYDLVSNRAYMVMAALVRNLKSWFAMMMHLKADRKRYIAMEFRRFIGWQPTTDRLSAPGEPSSAPVLRNGSPSSTRQTEGVGPPVETGCLSTSQMRPKAGLTHPETRSEAPKRASETRQGTVATPVQAPHKRKPASGGELACFGTRVLHTVLDARAAGRDVVVLDDALRAVNPEPGDGARAVDRMRAARVQFAPTGTALAGE